MLPQPCDPESHNSKPIIMRSLSNVLVVVILCGLAQGQSIGINFNSGRDLGAQLSSDEVAGHPDVAQDNWNNTNGFASGNEANLLGANAGALVDSSGDVTGATVTWAANGTWNTNNGTGSGDNKLMNGYIDHTGGFSNVEVLNITYANYDVYVYFGSDGNGRTGAIESTTAGQTFSYTTSSQQGGGFPASYVLTEDESGGNPVANFCVFRNQRSTTFSARVNRGSSNSGFHGIQIVATAPPEDADNDGLIDSWELANGLSTDDDGSANLVNGPDGDPDNDGLSNLEEFIRDTNPRESDSDGDGLADGVESNSGNFVSLSDTGSDPLSADTDGDGLLDGAEVAADPFVTDPNNTDTDGDVVIDRVEITRGSDPTDPADLPGDEPTGRVISMNFDGQAGVGMPGAVTRVAGSIPVGNWNNSGPGNGGNVGNGFALVDNSGLATGVTVSWSVANHWSTNGGDNSGGDAQMMQGYLDNFHDRPPIEVNGIPASFQASGYELRIYHNTDSGGTMGFTVDDGGGPVTHYSHQAGGSGSNYPLAGVDPFGGAVGYIGSQDSNPASTTPSNYTIFTGLTGSSFTIRGVRGAAGDTRARPNGFQIMASGPSADQDQDGLADSWEVANGLDPADDGTVDIDNGPEGDPDNDGSSNLEEYERGTDPRNDDSDGDGLADGVESATGIFVGADDTGTEPLDDDSDGDGLPDGEEVSADPFATNPNEADTDGDQLGDSLELELGTDPLDQASGPDGDADSDGSSNLDEVLTGTNPNNEDTDGDGLVDGVETNTGVFISESDTGSNPLNTDSDSDGLTDRVEVEIHATNPNEADSDGDGRDDAVEIEAGSDPNDALSRSRMPQPTGYWSFDDQGAGGVTADLSGAGNEGTLNGGPEIVEGPCGPGDFALKFDGLDDSVTTGVSLFTGGDTFTMSGWIRFETAQIGDRIGLFGQNDAVEFGLINPTTLHHWSNVGGALDATVAASSPEWMHLAVTGTSRERVLYVNGVAEANVGPSSAGSSSTFSFNIGGSGIFDNSGNWFRGEIDDVAVWDQVLAPDEIALLASCAISPLGSPRSDVGIEITEFARTPAGQISISWKSRADKQYDILSHPNLSVAREDWAEVAGAQDIRGDASGISSVSLAPPFEGSGYLAVREESLPPLFEDDFETDTGWVAIVNDANGNTNWERGTPNGSTGPLSGADDSINAWSTNLGDFGIDSDISLRSPAIDLTGVAAAELSFDAYRDGDGFGEFASIRFLRALDQSQLGEESAIDMTLFDSDWVAQTIPVVPEAIGESVVIEFNFVSDSSPDAFSGLSIDNVRMATP